MTHGSSPVRRLAGLRRLGAGSGPTMAQVVDHLADRSTPLGVILMAALAMVPSPGLPLGVLTGLAIAWLAGAALWGRPGGLPETLSRRTLPRPILEAALRRLVPLMRRVERRTRSRLAPLAQGRGAMVAQAAIVLQGLVLAVPLPFGNIAPALAILLLAAGLLWRDGLGVLLGHALGVASVGVILGLGWSALVLAT
ncbi:putative Exopolysaccharide synthesis (Exopolysaccharide synthesis, ExoD,11-185) [Magnetospirillum sp. XM-1]|uniref:exopolysaccharide biosynthesis protein n=1 Tax=Magnetospirillum sp. XM-1 TaxID=1663591 RepID=UPI00073DD003|nr:exopolysaccharide biosynthesis protein [Magnetospirillum sp. XM-1]CUW38392.1 putative Exopolysaccharide synthesis (Exopolysaccharide synthesis, ExoD,11-185) [Magnetospirillum sp. XM-1]